MRFFTYRHRQDNAAENAARTRYPSGNVAEGVAAPRSGRWLQTLVVMLLLSPVAVMAQTHALNDTGLDWSGSSDIPASNATTCSAAHPDNQDCRQGRDADTGLFKAGAGHAGFDYTKVCNSGEFAGQGDCPVDPVLGDGDNDWACTLDNVTGLLWEVKTTSGLRSNAHTYSWYDSNSPDGNAGKESNGSCETAGRCDTQKYAEDINAMVLCGYADWRMPHIKELEDIVNYGRDNPAVDIDHFPNQSNDMVWSGTPLSNNTTAALVAKFNNGTTGIAARSTAQKVRLTRGAGTSVAGQGDSCRNGNPPRNPDEIYVVHGDGTVTDTRTGLMWKQCMEGHVGTDCVGMPLKMAWGDALLHAKSHQFAGHDDWRLPNIRELRSLVEDCAWGPAINESIFPNHTNIFVWSSSPYAIGSSSSWGINFANGYAANNGRPGSHGVHLVRVGETFDPVPVLSSVMLTGSPASTTADFVATSTLDSVGWWVIVPQGSPSPSAEEVVAQDNYGSVVLAASGSATMFADMPANFTAIGLQPETEYDLHIIAETPERLGRTVEHLTFTTASDVPGAPTDVVAVAGNGEVDLSWTAPVASGAGPILEYTVTAAPGSAMCTAMPPATSCVVTGLTNGTTYVFSVVATNSAGDGPAATATAMPVGPPDAPLDVAAVVGDGTVLITWNTPADNGDPIVGFMVSTVPASAGCTAAASETACEVSGLTNDVSYTFSVVATNGVGDSPAASVSAIPGAAIFSDGFE